MPIRKKGETWFYEFMKNGKRFYGTCEGCNTQKQAEAYLARMKEKQGATATARNVEQLYELRHQEITGNAGIPLANAFDEALKYNTRTASPTWTAFKRKIFADFVSFMEATHPEIKNISEVGINHATEYLTRLINNGRFNNDVAYTRNGQQITTSYGDRKLSHRTINYYKVACAEVFDKLKIVAGIIHNPFSQFRPLPKQEEEREVFTDDEIKSIYDKASDFVRPLFIVAFNTGMREGDICTLKWDEINLKEKKIRRKQNKTKNYIEIPIMPELHDYLIQWGKELANKIEIAKQTPTPKRRKKNNRTMTTADYEKYADYVFPQHAKLYLDNQSGISYRIKEFLEGIGIKTTRTPQGRTRAVSIKDLHSCRHTFCKRAADAGVPLVTVQAIVGHMTQAMTNHYSSHATFKDKQKAMEAMSNSTDAKRVELLEKISKLPTETLEKLLKGL